MKKLFAFLLPALLFAGSVTAQDIITTRSGNDIKAKVAEIGLNDVKYKIWENPDGPLIVIAKEDILLIRYEDGKKEIFEDFQNTAGQTSNSVPGLAGKDLYRQGNTDARRYYRGSSGASVGTLVVSILGGPLFGLIPAIACASTTPSYKNLDFPSEELMKKRDYSQGYAREARRIKSHKVWINFGIGSAIAVLITILANSAQ